VAILIQIYFFSICLESSSEARGRFKSGVSAKRKGWLQECKKTLEKNCLRFYKNFVSSRLKTLNDVTHWKLYKFLFCGFFPPTHPMMFLLLLNISNFCLMSSLQQLLVPLVGPSMVACLNFHFKFDYCIFIFRKNLWICQIIFCNSRNNLGFP
jgi:hypothetical protein